MSTLLSIAAIFLLAGFVQGLSGFGAGLIAIPLLCLVIDIKTAVPLCMLNSIVITGYLLLRLNSHLQIRKMLPLCLCAIPGIYVGTTVLCKLDSKVMGFFLGLLLLGYSIYCLSSTPRPRNIHTAWGYVAGFSAGAIGSAFSTGGPPVIIYTSLNNWSKDQVKATLTGFFAFNSCLGAVVHAITGLTTVTVVHNFFVSAPAVIFGTAAGSLLYNRLAREEFIRLIFTFLAVMGVVMLISNAPRFT